MSKYKTASRLPAGRTAQSPVDAIDLKLLELLRDDGRMPVQTLAEKASISRASAYARLERLRVDGILEGYSARVNTRKLGLGVTALILVAMRQPAWRTLRAHISAMREVEFCALTTGEYDILALVRVPDVETLRDVILDRLQSMDDVRATQTLFILDEVVKRPYVLP